MECLLPYLRMVTVPHIMVGLERMLDYRGVGLARFHCIMCTTYMYCMYCAYCIRTMCNLYCVCIIMYCMYCMYYYMYLLYDWGQDQRKKCAFAAYTAHFFQLTPTKVRNIR